MNTLEMARAAGFVILLDGKIGRETYHSVMGSLSALERFQALCGGRGCGTADERKQSADSRDSVPSVHEGREP